MSTRRPWSMVPPRNAGAATAATHARTHTQPGVRVFLAYCSYVDSWRSHSGQEEALMCNLKRWMEPDKTRTCEPSKNFGVPSWRELSDPVILSSRSWAPVKISLILAYTPAFKMSSPTTLFQYYHLISFTTARRMPSELRMMGSRE